MTAAVPVPHAPSAVTPRRPRRVLHAFEPATAGVPAFVTAVAGAQARRGDAVVVLAPEWLAEPYRTADVDGWCARTWRPERWAPILSAARDLRRAVADVDPDVVHLHSFYAGVAGRLGPALDVPVVHQPHAWPFSRAGRGRAVARALERRLARRADALVTVSEDEADEGRGAGIDLPTVVSAVPVDLEHVRPVDAVGRARARAGLGVSTEDPVVVCVGRLEHQKGQDRLLAAWRHHRAAVHEVRARLVLVGPGRRDDVLRWAGDETGVSVHHVGGVDDVRPWLAAADVAVQPSRWEGMSMAVAEELATGVPVVATDVAGMREMIGSGPQAAGAVVPDPDDLVPAVLRRLLDPALRRREGVAARQRAEGLFAIDRIVERIDQAYARATRGVTA